MATDDVRPEDREDEEEDEEEYEEEEVTHGLKLEIKLRRLVNR